MAQIQDIGKYGAGFYQGDIADRRHTIDMSKKIHMLSPTDTPFYVMLANMRKENADQAKFEWMEDEYFTIRTFNADIVVADGSADSSAWLALRNPNDIQGLKAPPYIEADEGYDTTETLLYKITFDHDADDVFDETLWIIFEKSAVANAGVWRSAFDISAVATTVTGTNIDTSTDPTGYFMVLGHLEGGVGAFDFSAADGHHGSGGTILTNESVIINSSGSTGTKAEDSGTAAAVDTPSSQTLAAGTYPCKVEAFTPTVLNGGHYEFSGLPEESRKSIRLMENYTQIEKTPYSISNTMIASKMVGGTELSRIQAFGGIEHKQNMEQIVMFNEASAYDTANAESPKRTTQGMGVGKTGKNGFIKTHHPGTAITSATSTYCILNTIAGFYPDLSDACAEIFSDAIIGSTTKVMYVSQKWLGAFTTNAGSVASASAPSPFPIITQMSSGGSAETYGIAVTAYRSPYGLLKVVSAPLLRGIYEDWALIVDFKQVALKVLRDTHIVKNSQGNDEDGYQEYYITEAGLKCMHEQTHAMLRLVAS